MFAAETWDQRYSEQVNLVLQQAGHCVHTALFTNPKCKLHKARKDFLPLC